MEILGAVKKESALGGILLVAGCSIGGGMIGLPLVSAYAGLLPSSLVLLLCSLFMMSTGLLLLEAILWFEREVNLISLAKNFLGRFGERVTWVCFLSIFYCLHVAYITGSGALVRDFLSFLLRIDLPPFLGNCLSGIFVCTCIIVGTAGVELLNAFFMIGLIACYALLVGLAATHIDSANYLQMQWSSALPCIPIMLISFGYHNVIPTLSSYLKRNVRAIRMAIIVGNLLPLCFYLIWQTVILGIIPYGTDLQALTQQNAMITTLLKGVTGSPLVIAFVHAFAFFAIITSFMTNSLSCVDFLADGFGVTKSLKTRALLCCLVLLPPLLLSLFFPHLFLKALGFAGGFATLLLFGILPTLIVWRGRYVQNQIGARILPGGKAALALILLLSLFFLTLELNKQIF